MGCVVALTVAPAATPNHLITLLPPPPAPFLAPRTRRYWPTGDEVPPNEWTGPDYDPDDPSTPPRAPSAAECHGGDPTPLSHADELAFASPQDQTRGVGFACVAGSLHIYERRVNRQS